ncbi:hypothetical protein ACSTHT_00055, partial [Vibrio parahaemolyticus]
MSELKVIVQTNKEALAASQPRLKNITRERRSLVLYASPLMIGGAPAVVWTMGWVSAKNSELL